MKEQERQFSSIADRVTSEVFIEEIEELRNLFLKTLQDCDPELSKRVRSKAFLDMTKKKADAGSIPRSDK